METPIARLRIKKSAKKARLSLAEKAGWTRRSAAARHLPRRSIALQLQT
jgi:hypothetical protein